MTTDAAQLEQLLEAVEEHRQTTHLHLNDWPPDEKLWELAQAIREERYHG